MGVGQKGKKHTLRLFTLWRSPVSYRKLGENPGVLLRLILIPVVFSVSRLLLYFLKLLWMVFKRCWDLNFNVMPCTVSSCGGNSQPHPKPHGHPNPWGALAIAFYGLHLHPVYLASSSSDSGKPPVWESRSQIFWSICHFRVSEVHLCTPETLHVGQFCSEELFSGGKQAPDHKLQPTRY